MPNYTYAGLKQGEKVNGSIIAASRDDAVSRLKKDKIIITVLELQDKSRGKSGLLSVRGRGKVPTKEVMVFSKKFATMVKSGLPILNTLQMLVDQTENKTFKKMVDEIYRDVESGVPMSEAFGKHKKCLTTSMSTWSRPER
jgi:type IV pilus assembly protein PilC